MIPLSSERQEGPFVRYELSCVSQLTSRRFHATSDVCCHQQRRRARAPSFPCQVIHTSTRAALFMTASHVAVLNKQVNTFSRLLSHRKSCRRVQSCRHTWYVTTGASQSQSCRCCDDFATRVTRSTRHAAAPVVAAARSTRSTRFMLHRVVCCTVTVAVLGGLACAQWRSAFARH